MKVQEKGLPLSHFLFSPHIRQSHGGNAFEEPSGLQEIVRKQRYDTGLFGYNYVGRGG